MVHRHVLKPAARPGARETAADRNARDLKLRFVARLVAEKPRSVLDVGAGDGLVIERLRRNGVPAFGLEVELEQVVPLVRAGQRAAVASAEALPFDRDTFDWVALRHVLHHFAEPARALAEADRVARRGLLVAEPWFDTTIPSQRVARDVDRWRKRQHERAGRVHRENLSVGDVLRLLPEGRYPEVRAESLLDLRVQPQDELELELNREVIGLERDHPDRLELIELKRSLRDVGATLNGSSMVVLRRAASVTGRGARRETR